MRIISACLLLFILAAFTLPSTAQAQTTGSVAVSVSLLQRIALPESAIITVQLADATRTDIAAQVISSQQRTANGSQAPFTFTLTYNTAQIVSTNTYIVQANIVYDGAVRYRTTTPYRVITNGNPTSANIVLEAVGSLPNTSAGNLPLVVAGIMLGLVLGSHLLRRSYGATANPAQ